MITEQKRYPMTLARIEAVAASPNGFETVTPQGARELLAEIRERAIELETHWRRRQDNWRSSSEAALNAANAMLKLARHWIEKWRSDETHDDSADWYMSRVEAALASQPEAPDTEAAAALQQNAEWVAQCEATGRHPDMREAPKGPAAEAKADYLNLCCQWVERCEKAERDLAAANARAEELTEKCYTAAQLLLEANARADAEGKERERLADELARVIARAAQRKEILAWHRACDERDLLAAQLTEARADNATTLAKWEASAQEVERLTARVTELDVLERVAKYAREDRAVTPGCTRLARALDELEANRAAKAKRGGA